MGEFGWAYVKGTQCGGTEGSLQFAKEDLCLTGSTALTYNNNAATLTLSGTLNVSGAINTNELNIDVTNKTVTNIEQYGSSTFGDSVDDVHMFTGSLTISGASNSTVTEVGDTVTPTNPALIVSGAAVFTDNIQVKGTFYGASPIKFASALALKGSDGEEVELDGATHKGRKKIIGDFDVTGAINVIGSHPGDGVHIKMGNLLLENCDNGAVFDDVGPNIILKSATDNPLHRPAVTLINNVSNYTNNAYCGRIEWKATNHLGTKDVCYAYIDTMAKTDSGLTNDHGILTFKYRNNGMTTGFPTALSIGKYGSYSKTLISVYGCMVPFEGYGKQSCDHTLGEAARPWGEFYIGDDKYIKLGHDQDVLFGFNTLTNNLEVSGRALSLKDNLKIQTNGYVNFGSVEESIGYGLRDNIGVIEVKDSGGEWTDIQQAFTPAKGPATSMQFASAGQTLTGSGDLTFDLINSILSLSGTLNVSGAINTNVLNVDVTNQTVTNIEQYGSTKFGNSADDVHIFTGSLLIDGAISSSNSVVSELSASNYVSASMFYGDGSNLTGIDNAAINNFNNTSQYNIVTAVAANSIQGESNLTFDGSNLVVVGSVSSSANIVAGGVAAVAAEFNSVRIGTGDYIELGDAQEAKIRLNPLTDSIEIEGKSIYAKTNLRLKSNNYLNFGPTEGLAGYGLRDNSGVIEIKNSSGTWENIASYKNDVNNRVLIGTNYNATPSDYFIGVSASSNVQIQLPDASLLTSGKMFVFKDESGNAENNTIQINTFGNQTIDGQQNIILDSPRAAVNLYTDGVSKYFIF